MVNIITLDAKSMQEFNQTYHKHIRLAIAWDKIRDEETGLIYIDKPDQKIHLLHRECEVNGHGLGEFYTTTVGNGDCIMRAPALRYGNEYLLLDGNHRIQAFRPRVIILDYIRPDYYHILNYFDQGLNFVESCRRD